MYETIRERFVDFAIGTAHPDDDKRVRALRTMGQLERNAAILSDRKYRGPALRAGAFECRVHEDVIARVLSIAMAEATPREARALWALEHEAAVTASRVDQLVDA